MIIPGKLRSGDTIGIVSPSAGVAGICPRRFERGIHELERMGFRIIIGEHARSKLGYMAGTIKERAEDLHNMFRNPEVKAIIATIGGTCSHQILEHLDYELIRNNPKILLGYSDITALQLAIYKKTGLATYLGPAVLPQFGEYGGLLPYTEYYVRSLLMEGDHVQFSASDHSVVEYLEWDKEDDRRRERVENRGFLTIKSGQASGPIIAGNMGVMLLLAGTDYFPDLDGAILCIEDDEEETPASIDRYLTQLRHLGVFGRIAGLVVGRFHPAVGFEPGQLEDLINRVTEGYSFPVVLNADFGHTDPMITLPNGIKAELLADQSGKVSFSLLQSAVKLSGETDSAATSQADY